MSSSSHVEHAGRVAPVVLLKQSPTSVDPAEPSRTEGGSEPSVSAIVSLSSPNWRRLLSASEIHWHRIWIVKERTWAIGGRSS